RPSFLDGRDAHPTNMCKLFNSRSLLLFFRYVVLKKVRYTHAGRCPMPDARCPMPDARCPMPDARCPMPDAR
ncbi:hypothetical protein, partial [Microcoleus sp. B4-C1]|uniref:hypothetical protein n=1 Tax=Microcoleus sp. B4-C1 TaxID=2818660 RepID=UPI002FD5080E